LWSRNPVVGLEHRSKFIKPFLSLSLLLNCFFFSVVRPIIELSGPSQPLQEGDSANLTCKIIESFPEPELTIFKNEDPQQKTSIFEYGDLLFDDTKRTLTLLLTNVTERVVGKYTCKAENGGGNFTESLYLRVRSKLIIIVINIVTIKSIRILHC